MIGTDRQLQIPGWPWAALSLLFLLSLPHPLHSSCEPGRQPFYGYAFIDPTIAAGPEHMAAYYLDFGSLYKQYYQPAAALQADENLREWQERYCDYPETEDLQAIIYRASEEDLRYLYQQIAAGGSLLDRLYETNSFVYYLRQHKCTDVIDYLILTRRCEAFVQAPADPWKPRQRSKLDQDLMRSLIDDAHKGFRATRSHFLKLRYAYQAIRLAHYLKDYPLTLELCDYYLPKTDNDPSIIEHWIAGHKAGALQALGDYPQSAYLYSRIYALSPGRRESAFRSFRINSDRQWMQALMLCRNDRERADLYALRAHSSEARLPDEMDRIYHYDPRNPALELLLLREMQRLEKDLLGAGLHDQTAANQRYHGIPRPNAGKRALDMLALAKKIGQERKVSRPQLWLLAQGYIETLTGDYYAAARTFERSERELDNETLRQQLQVFRLVLDILALKDAERQTEERIAEWKFSDPLFQSTPHFARLTRDKLRRLYTRSGYTTKALMLDYTYRHVMASGDADILEDLITLCRKPNPSRLELAIIAHPDGGTIYFDLLNLKASLLIQQGKIATALEIFQQIPQDQWAKYGAFNPFADHLRDCIHCPQDLSQVKPMNAGESPRFYDKAAYLKAMLEMERRAIMEADPNVAAIRYYRLGLTHYNLTYFGQAWAMADAFRSGSSLRQLQQQRPEQLFSHPRYPLGNREFFDCSRARIYFEKARDMAAEPEIAARAAFMAARCESNAYYSRLDLQQARSYDNFKKLQEQYSRTQFYNRIIEECLYFKAYARQ